MANYITILQGRIFDSGAIPITSASSRVEVGRFVTGGREGLGRFDGFVSGSGASLTALYITACAVGNRQSPLVSANAGVHQDWITDFTATSSQCPYMTNSINDISGTPITAGQSFSIELDVSGRAEIGFWGTGAAGTLLQIMGNVPLLANTLGGS